MNTHSSKAEDSDRRIIHLGISSASDRTADALITVQVWIDELSSDPPSYGITKFNGSDALDMCGATAVIHWHKFLRKSIFHEADVVEWIQCVQALTGNQYLPRGFEYRTKADDVVLYASLATLSVQHVLGNVRRLPLPATFKRWIEMATAVHHKMPFRWWNDLMRSIKLHDAFMSEQLHPDFCHNLEFGIT